MSKSRDKRNKGPFCYKNWLAALQSKPLQWTVEFPLYSDVGKIIGNLTSGCGPYQLLNTGAFFPQKGALRPVMVLRIDDHEEFDAGDMNRTDTQNYHGGDLCDEIAALVSLCLGIRLKAGELSRRFDPNGDPKGKPQYIGFQEIPSFSKNRRGRIIPNATGERSIQEIPLLCQLTRLSPLDAAILVRSARMYQEAMWFAEAQPEISWLFMVSSIEVAANHYLVNEASTETLVEMMRASHSQLVNVLQGWGGKKLISEAAQAIKRNLAAKRKFRDFITEFRPPPPPHRPPDNLRVTWNENPTSLTKSLNIIYDHRSKALHESIPFPWPMCEPPIPTGNSFNEIPSGLATKGKGGTWVHEKDSPMLLHVFEYIVRNALLNWWRKALTENKNET